MPPPLISSAGAADAQDWDDYVRRHPAGTAYHLYGWQRVFGHALRADTDYLLARSDSGQVCGLLPLVQLKSTLFGNFFVSLPYANFGGAIGDNEQIEASLMQDAGEHAASLGASHIEFRDTRLREGWAVSQNKVEMVRPMEDNVDAFMKNIGSKLRAQGKRASREGATVARGRYELLDEFYTVFARNMRDLGTPVHSRDFFAAILDCMQDDSEIVIVRVGNQPAAAGLLIHHGQSTEIPSASSLREYNRISVNMMLYAECLKAAIDRGSAEFDFGRSSPESGTFRFKKQWGAEPRQLYWHYWLAPGADMPSLNPSNPRYELAIRAWTRLPVWLTKLIGPPIVRRLP